MNSARRARRGALGLLLLSATGCTDWAGYDLDYLWNALPVLSTMRTSVGYDPYDMPRLPPEHSVPLSTPNGNTPPPFAQAALDSAAATLRNPFAGGANAAVLARGQFVYATHCAVCHGPEAAGNGPVVGPGKFPLAPALNGAATAARSDGYIYGVLAVGRGLMPAYGEKITHTDRWAVVSYVRQLAGQAGTAPAVAAAPAPAAPAPATTTAPAVEPATAPAAEAGAPPQ